MDPMNFRVTGGVFDRLTAIEQGTNGIQQRFRNLFGSVCVNLGMINQALETELITLTSQNKILKLEITQWKSVHTAELNAAVDGYLVARNLIIEKLNAIIERLNAFPQKYKCCGYTPINTQPFQDIVDELRSKDLESHYAELRIYPQFGDKQTNEDRPEEQTAVAYVLDISEALLTEPIIMENMNKIEIFEPKVNSAKVETHKLMKEKEIMIDFHRRHLEDLNRAEKFGRIKEVIKKVRAIYDNISWEIPTTNGMECVDCNQRFGPGSAHPTVRANLIIQGHPIMQQEVQERVNLVREHVLIAVQALESLIIHF